jgi:hypothetical protein
VCTPQPHLSKRERLWCMMYSINDSPEIERESLINPVHHWLDARILILVTNSSTDCSHWRGTEGIAFGDRKSIP